MIGRSWMRSQKAIPVKKIKVKINGSYLASEIIFHHLDVPQFIYPLTNYRTSWLFQVLAFAQFFCVPKTALKNKICFKKRQVGVQGEEQTRCNGFFSSCPLSPSSSSFPSTPSLLRLHIHTSCIHACGTMHVCVGEYTQVYFQIIFIFHQS